MALKLNSSSGGSVTLQEPTTASNYTLTVPAQTGTIATTVDAGNYYAFKNRIINGNMAIDQRNAGASVTLSGTSQFPTDRFGASKDTAGATCTAQRSTVAPPGFINSLLWTTSTGASPGTGDDSIIRQYIEGFNFADFGFGTASAQPFTISFWVRSSITGTYGVSLANSAATRCYMASYTVNTANTYELKTITVPGDTSGTWLTDNGIGLRIFWDLGSGSSRSIAATSSWGSSYGTGLTGGVKISANTGATFYITGVQLEKGTVATSFDYRPYGTELALCQRYYQTRKDGFAMLVQGPTTGNNTYISSAVPFIVTMRSSPTMTFFDRSNTSGQITILTSGSSMNGTDLAGPYGSIATADYVLAQTYNEGTRYGFRCGFTASAEL